MNEATRAALVRAVQRNCDIADARHASEQTLCVYLLQMREFYRWQGGFAPDATLDRAAVGDWIAHREALWDELEAESYAPLSVHTDRPPIDPFDAQTINEQLLPQGLLYGAGQLGRGRPVFFLADLHSVSVREGLAVQQAGTERARGLIAPPAVLAGAGTGPIVLRRDALARIAWERLELHRLRPSPQGALHAMVSAYGLDRDGQAGLAAWLEDQVEAALLHEIGEYRAGLWLGSEFTRLREALPSARDDAWARALRDLLADLGVTLPVLIERGMPGPLHAWFAGFDGLRAALFPGLEAAYRAWCGGAGDATLSHAIAQGRSHFEALAQGLLRRWQEEGPSSAAAIARTLESASAVCPVAAPD